MGKPLRHSQGEDSENSHSPEAYLISALLEEGAFTPGRYHVAREHIEAWAAPYEWCESYQERAGAAPPVELFLAHFPDFELVGGISASWAADRVLMAAASRRLRVGMQEAAMQLRDGDVGRAYDLIGAVPAPRLFVREPSDVFDHGVLEGRFGLDRHEVPWPTLQRLTRGGIIAGELVYLAARLANGKSWSLCSMAARCAEAGARVGYDSMEMPAGDVAGRILAKLAGHDQELLDMLRGEDSFDRKRAQDALLNRTPGSVRIYDPGMGNIHSVEHVRWMCSDFDIVFVDHVGLMHTGDGKRAIEDWRVQATISNVLREITLSTSTTVVGAAQINREGERGGSRPPGAKNLAGSDALGQDADIVVTQRMLSPRIVMMSAEKVRNGPTGRWYTRFEPSRGRFEEIGKDLAETMMEEDDML